ncbi:hypothetical protein AB2B41_08230 [Marimonas sp. MJW-29]|uniref:Uncharacterized protein n=1 Tax=Sulfitobacter sediminis TaxID=3234186 RepID=A0ABV3RL19_9RHOB
MTATGKATTAAALGAAVLFVALGILTDRHLQPDGMDPFDSRLTGYTGDEARLYLAALAEAGSIETYLGLFRQLDTIFPVLLALTFLGAIWLGTRGLPLPLRLVLGLAPVAYLWADLGENARVAMMLRAGPAVDDATVAAASFFTRVKWSCLALSAMVILATWGYRRISMRAEA